jgi:hypothetical protein
MKQITIRKYGARLISDSESAIVQSMRDQNRLWNKLVEIERDNTLKYREIVTQADSELSALAQEHSAAEERLEHVRKQRNRARAIKRSKKIEGGEDYAAKIKSISADLAGLRARMKEIRGRAKEAAKPQLEALEEQRRAAVKQAVKEADLWWAHSELMTNAFDVARSRALKSNAELRFHRFDGRGRIGVRFSPGILLSAPPATEMLKVREATEEEMQRAHFKIGRKKRTVAMDMRIGKPDNTGAIPKATFIVTVHDGMPLPMDTPLKTAVVKREMNDEWAKYSIVLMFVDPQATPQDKPLQTKAAGVDFGWRMVHDREWEDKTGLRVATIASSDGRKQHINIPPDMIARFERADRLRSDLSLSANGFWERTSPLFTEEALSKLAEDEWLNVLVGKARRARMPYPSLMRAIVKAHGENPILGTQADAEMQHWAREAKKLSLAASFVRTRAVDRRQHYYRNVAAKMVFCYGLIAVKNTDLKSLAKLVDADGEENPLHEKARANRFIASPSELRNAIKQAAMREGLEVVEIDPQHTTTTCASCGHVHDGPIRDLTFVCDGCGAVHDQDENSAELCLKKALESSAYAV